MAQAAPTLKRVHLELGGKSALIVRHDADIQRAAQMAVAVLSVNAGQGCALLTRLLVHNSVRKQFVETRSEEHTSELQSLMRISYAVFCLKKKKKLKHKHKTTQSTLTTHTNRKINMKLTKKPNTYSNK